MMLAKLQSLGRNTLDIFARMGRDTGFLLNTLYVLPALLLGPALGFR